MGRKRKPQKKLAPPADQVKGEEEDDEVPEGYEILDANEWADRIKMDDQSRRANTKKRKRNPYAIFDDQPWKSLDTSSFEYNDSPMMLEALDGSYFDKLFVKQEPAKKKQKISHPTADSESESDESDKSEESEDQQEESTASFKKLPLLLSPKVLKERQEQLKKQGKISSEIMDDDDEDIVDQEDDYELEDDDVFDVKVAGVQQDDSYSSDEYEDVDDEPEEPVPIEEWCGADIRIIESLKNKLSIKRPTLCQQMVLPVALSHRQDILLAAPTGSGKTFAFGIPIITMIMELLEQNEGKELPRPFSLILAPTRELALQITKNLKIAATSLPIKIVPVVGGMAPQKQERLLKKNPEIIVGTPGRLWNLLHEGKLVSDYPLIRFLVIDEADRMVSQGNYKELRNILNRLAPWKGNKKSKKEESNEFDAAELWEKSNKKLYMPVPRQTYICSATLTTSNFIQDFEDGKKLSGKEGTYEGLLSCIDFQRTRKVIDITTQQLTAKNLSEAKVLCLLEEKDYYLYYLLKQYPGRTLVFVNSIHCLHRLISLFGLLRFPAFSLHAKMQQRQRLKNLDRFQDNEHCVLLASDVAARGLDIPNIDHVIHYQIPRTSELYVHRSGRTARALKKGVSVMLVDPSDEPSFRKICKLLKKTTADIPDFPVELRYLNPIRKIVDAAREVDLLLHTKKKNDESSKWLFELADEADIDTSHLMEEEDDDTARERKKSKELLEQKKRVLRELLQEPIVKRGTSTKYITPKVLKNTEKRVQKKNALKDIKQRNTLFQE